LVTWVCDSWPLSEANRLIRPVPPLPGPPVPLPVPTWVSELSRPVLRPGTISGSSTATATPMTASRRPAAASGEGSHTSTSRPSPVKRRPKRRTRSTLSATSSHRKPVAPTMNGITGTLSTKTATGTE
jgi:hypothetical protein